MKPLPAPSKSFHVPSCPPFSRFLSFPPASPSHPAPTHTLCWGRLVTGSRQSALFARQQSYRRRTRLTRVYTGSAYTVPRSAAGLGIRSPRSALRSTPGPTLPKHAENSARGWDSREDSRHPGMPPLTTTGSPVPRRLRTPGPPGPRAPSAPATPRRSLCGGRGCLARTPRTSESGFSVSWQRHRAGRRRPPVRTPPYHRLGVHGGGLVVRPGMPAPSPPAFLSPSLPT